MLKTPSSTVIGGAFWTPDAVMLGSDQSFDQIMKRLFANNEQGAYFDPNDLSTMFQDAAGTIPVTAAGQPVALVKDKSGRSNHVLQTNSSMRPTLQRNAVTGAYYLAFDGTDDFLVTNNIDFTATDKMSVVAGVHVARVGSGETFSVIAELSTNIGLNNGSFTLTSPHSVFGNVAYGSKGTARSDNIYANISSEQRVIIAKSSIASGSNSVRINGSDWKNSIQSQGTGNFGNHPLYIGRRGGTTLPFNGHIYGLIVLGRLATDAETAAIEKEFAKRMGVTLSV